MTSSGAESRNATLYAHDKEYVWRHPAALEGLALTVKDVFEFRDGMTIRADGADGEWLIDCALPDEFGVWFAAREDSLTPSGARSPESYEREIRSLETRLSEECANSYRVAQELAEVKAERDKLAAYWEQADA